MGAPALNQDLYKVDVKLCYPFIEAVTNTLKVQCNLNVRTGKPVFKTTDFEDKPEILIMATIASKDTLASVAICFSNSVFLKLMGKMLGETYTQVTPEIYDGAMELMNIIFNQAKKALVAKGLSAIRSIPQIVFGRGLLVRYLTRGAQIILPFETEVGHFSIEISTQEISVSDSV